MLHLDFSLRESVLEPTSFLLSDTAEGSGLAMPILIGQVCSKGMEMRDVYVARAMAWMWFLPPESHMFRA